MRCHTNEEERSGEKNRQYILSRNKRPAPFIMSVAYMWYSFVQCGRIRIQNKKTCTYFVCDSFAATYQLATINDWHPILLIILWLWIWRYLLDFFKFYALTVNNSQGNSRHNLIEFNGRDLIIKCIDFNVWFIEEGREEDNNNPVDLIIPNFFWMS